MVDTTQWTRKLDRKTGKPRGEWTLVESQASDEPEVANLQLSVVVEHQATNEPKHWSLFCHRPDSGGAGQGQAWQVTGDAEYMHHQDDSDIDIMRSASFAWHQVVNNNLSNSQYIKVNQIATAEPAPRAPNRAAVSENCQGWVIRVLWRLAAEGIVQESAIYMLQRYMDPIN